MNSNKLSVLDTLKEGTAIGLKNAVSIFLASILYVLTILIPYINVGTTIAMNTIPLALSKGKVISPFFIFESKYRRYMGESILFFILMMYCIAIGINLLLVPGIVIALAWSLAFCLMIEKGLSPTEALRMSNQKTYGHKFEIFAISVLLVVFLCALLFLGGMILYFITVGFESVWFTIFVAVILLLLLQLLITPIYYGCQAVIYRNLTREEEVAGPEPVVE